MIVKPPTFHVFVGPMFSGKSSQLLLEVSKFKHQKKKVAIFKPNIDNRYSNTHVVTHNGWSQDAIVVSTTNELIDKVEDDDEVVVVDEAFMLPGIAKGLEFLYRQGLSVLVSTLDISYQGRQFTETSEMLAWATHVVKCTAVCDVCGEPARFTHKKLEEIGGDAEIEVGGAERYSPRCFTHHPKIGF